MILKTTRQYIQNIATTPLTQTHSKDHIITLVLQNLHWLPIPHNINCSLSKSSVRQMLILSAPVKTNHQTQRGDRAFSIASPNLSMTTLISSNSNLFSRLTYLNLPVLFLFLNTAFIGCVFIDCVWFYCF